MNRREALGGLFALPFIFKGLTQAKVVPPVIKPKFPVGLWSQIPPENHMPYITFKGIEMNDIEEILYEMNTFDHGTVERDKYRYPSFDSIIRKTHSGTGTI